MKRVDLEQGSQGWLLYRMEHSNASEAGALMGVAPSWMQVDTPFKLWLYKNGMFEVEENEYMRHGHKYEPEALQKLEIVLGAMMEPAVFDAEDNIRSSASLDGYGFIEKIDETTVTVKAEIKCPATGKRSETWKAAENGEIPPHYYWQIVHQEMVCPTGRTYFAVYDAESEHIITLNLDEIMEGWRDDVDVLRKAWEEFYDNPPEPDWNEREDLAWRAAAEAYLEEKAIIADAEARMKGAKEALIEMAGNKKSRGFGVAVSQKERKGAVQYKKVPELEGVNLEQYRGKSSTYWEVRALAKAEEDDGA